MNSRRVPPPLSSDRLESQLERLITDYLAGVRRSIARQVLDRVPEILAAHEAPRFDAADGRLTVAGVALEWLELDPQRVARQLEMFGGQVIELANESVMRQLADATPREKRQRLKALRLDTLEPWMLKRVQEWAAANAALIVSQPEQIAAQVQGRVWTAVRDGKRPEQLADELRFFLEAPPAKAQLIARDQVGKLQSDIIAGRQQELGIDSYFWETADDRRVVGRPGGLYPKGSARHQNHWIRRGRLFVANEGPPLVELVNGRRVIHADWTDGHPGDGIQCRCWRRPNLDKFLRRL